MSDIEREMSDPTAWGDPIAPRKKSEKRQRGCIVSTRLTRDELAQIQAEAQRRGQTISTFMRSAAMRDSFFEDDEPVEKLLALRESGRKRVTVAPAVGDDLSTEEIDRLFDAGTTVNVTVDPKGVRVWRPVGAGYSCQHMTLQSNPGTLTDARCPWGCRMQPGAPLNGTAVA